jgi:2-polyprenyl-6-methoxyphenol hydroxylase-like FAD-dependent oxidoreductase
MKQKVVVIGAGPVGALSALYAAQRGHDVEVYELRNGMFYLFMFCSCFNIVAKFFEHFGQLVILLCYNFYQKIQGGLIPPS